MPLATELPHPESPADGLAAVVALRRLADRMEAAEVERALRDGWTWAQVAEALGVTRQADPNDTEKRRKERERRSGRVFWLLLCACPSWAGGGGGGCLPPRRFRL